MGGSQRQASLADPALAADQPDEALARASGRELFGGPLAELQMIQGKLADMALAVDAAALLVYRAAWAKDEGAGRITREAAMAKLAGSEAGAYCAQEGMRIFAGYSYSVEYDIERYYRDAMLMCIGEGTNEILRQVIAKQLIDRNRI